MNTLKQEGEDQYLQFLYRFSAVFIEINVPETAVENGTKMITFA